ELRLTGFLLLSLAVAFPALAADRDLSTATPESVGMSSSGLEALGEAMSKQVEEGNLAGIVTLVARKGKIVHYEATGYQDIENQVPMQKDTIFRIFSMTKPVAGTALMILH